MSLLSRYDGARRQHHDKLPHWMSQRREIDVKKHLNRENKVRL